MQKRISKRLREEESKVVFNPGTSKMNIWEKKKREQEIESEILRAVNGRVGFRSVQL